MRNTMILADQPTIFPSDVLVAVSSIRDGSIRFPSGEPQASKNIESWCHTLGITPDQITGLLIEFADDKTYDKIVEVAAPGGVMNREGWVSAEAVVTTKPQTALLLPVADCNAVVFYDPVKKVLALAHLGWHSTVNNLARKLIDYLALHHGTDPGDILIHFPPSIRRDSYIFSHLADTPDIRWHDEPYASLQPDGHYKIDLLRYNLDECVSLGVKEEHIEVSGIDTRTNPNYYSHFARHDLDQTERSSGRFSVIAMMR